MTESTSSHPPRDKPDATSKNSRLTATASSTASELSDLKISLHRSLRQFPDFPSPGILFEDILPIFADPTLHQSLVRALELHVTSCYGPDQKLDIIVGLEARGFLFGPSLALNLGAGFVPVRKPGKLPGPTETAGFKKEYGEDFFQVQKDAIKPGQRVVIVDDIIATGRFHFLILVLGQNTNIFLGGSAAAAGSLVKKLGGTLIGYVFILELDFLKGRAKLDSPVYTLLSSQEDGPPKS